MSLQVRVSRRAERDADEVFEWLAERSPDGAARWYSAYLATLQRLESQAASYGPAPEAERLGINLRQIFFKTPKGRTYRALFIIEDDCVHVVSVRGAGQDLVVREDLEIPE